MPDRRARSRNAAPPPVRANASSVPVRLRLGLGVGRWIDQQPHFPERAASLGVDHPEPRLVQTQHGSGVAPEDVVAVFFRLRQPIAHAVKTIEQHRGEGRYLGEKITLVDRLPPGTPVPRARLAHGAASESIGEANAQRGLVPIGPAAQSTRRVKLEPPVSRLGQLADRLLRGRGYRRRPAVDRQQGALHDQRGGIARPGDRGAAHLEGLPLLCRRLGGRAAIKAASAGGASGIAPAPGSSALRTIGHHDSRGAATRPRRRRPADRPTSGKRHSARPVPRTGAKPRRHSGKRLMVMARLAMTAPQ